MNALGPLQFGLTPTAEVGKGNWSGSAYFRWLTPGLLARSILPNADGQDLAFSYGLGGGVRYYAANGLTGVNVGPGIEYLRVRVESSRDREAYLSTWVVPQLYAGYRFRFGRFLLGLGASAGYAFNLSARAEDLSGGTDPIEYHADDAGRPFASAHADVGIFLF